MRNSVGSQKCVGSFLDCALWMAGQEIFDHMEVSDDFNRGLRFVDLVVLISTK